MRPNATAHLYGQSVRTDLSWLPRDERAALEAAEPAQLPREGSVYVVHVGASSPSGATGPWRFVESLRAPSARRAYDAVRGRHPELADLPLRVDGPAGFHEGEGQ